MPAHDFAGRGAISEEDTEFLEVGRTTRADVLLRFGGPDLVRNGEDVFVYAWSFTQGFFVIGAPYGGAGTDVRKNVLLLLEFDNNARLMRFDRIGLGLFGGDDSKLDEWGLDGAEQPGSPRPARLLLAPSPAARGIDASALAGVRSLAVRVGAFRDRKGARRRVGYKTALGLTTELVLADRTTGGLVRNAVAMAWQAAGHRSVRAGADVTITGSVKVLALSGSLHLLAWDAVGELDVSLRIKLARKHGGHVIERRYRSRQEQSGSGGHSHFEELLEDCLAELMHKLASDAELVSRLPSGPK